MAIDLVGLLIALLIFGVVLYLINQYVPMAPPIKTIVNVVLILILCLFLIQLFFPGGLVIRR